MSLNSFSPLAPIGSRKSPPKPGENRPAPIGRTLQTDAPGFDPIFLGGGKPSGLRSPPTLQKLGHADPLFLRARAAEDPHISRNIFLESEESQHKKGKAKKATPLRKPPREPPLGNIKVSSASLQKPKKSKAAKSKSAQSETYDYSDHARSQTKTHRNMKFDPMTGKSIGRPANEPIPPRPRTPTKMKFDPMTGERYEVPLDIPTTSVPYSPHRESSVSSFSTSSSRMDPEMMDPQAWSQLSPRSAAMMERELMLKGMDTRMLDPRNIDPHTLSPRSLAIWEEDMMALPADPALMDPRLVDPRALSPRSFAMWEHDMMAFEEDAQIDPRMIDPRSLSPRSRTMWERDVMAFEMEDKMMRGYSPNTAAILAADPNNNPFNLSDMDKQIAAQMGVDPVSLGIDPSRMSPETAMVFGIDPADPPSPLPFAPDSEFAHEIARRHGIPPGGVMRMAAEKTAMRGGPYIKRTGAVKQKPPIDASFSVEQRKKPALFPVHSYKSTEDSMSSNAFSLSPVDKSLELKESGARFMKKQKSEEIPNENKPGVKEELDDSRKGENKSGPPRKSTFQTKRTSAVISKATQALQKAKDKQQELKSIAEAKKKKVPTATLR